MTADPLGLSGDITSATDRLLASVANLEDVHTPSLLPGWTRGHVLTHLARNADGAVNMLTWARTGVVTPQYRSWAAREADIEAGAARPVAQQLADLEQACARFAATADSMPADAWAQVVSNAAGREFPAAAVMWSRLREVEIHHVDLGLAYTADDWSEAFALRMAHTLAGDYTRRDDGPRLVVRAPEVGRDLPLGAGAETPVVSGPVRAVVAWLIGRDTGARLTVQPQGSLPPVPSWS